MWLETTLLIEGVMAFWLSALNVALLWRVVRQTDAAARRAAATVLACVCGGQCLEALLFLWLNGAASATDGWSAAALLVVRTALAVSTALISLLLLRALSLRR